MQRERRLQPGGRAAAEFSRFFRAAHASNVILTRPHDSQEHGGWRLACSSTAHLDPAPTECYKLCLEPLFGPKNGMMLHLRSASPMLLTQ